MDTINSDVSQDFDVQMSSLRVYRCSQQPKAFIERNLFPMPGEFRRIPAICELSRPLNICGEFKLVFFIIYAKLHSHICDNGLDKVYP